eukprot:PRCOL_00001379-RA
MAAAATGGDEGVTTRPLVALAGAAAFNCILGSLYLWSVYLAGLEAELGASRATLSACFSLATTCFTVASTVGLIVFGRAPPAELALGVLGVASFGMWFSGFSGTLWGLFAGFGVLFGACNGVGHGTSLRIGQSKLFDKRKGMATGVLFAARAGGTVLLAPLAMTMVAKFGALGALQLNGIVFAALAVPVYLALRASNVNYALKPPKDSKKTSIGALRPHAATCLKFSAILGLGAFSGLLSYGHAAPVLAARGAEASALGVAVSVFSAVNAGARLVGGGLVDSMSARHCLMIACAPAVAGLAIATLAPASLVAAMAGLCGSAATYGLLATCLAVSVGRLVGQDLFATAYGLIFTSWGVAGILGPVLGGALYDATRSYTLSLGAACLCAAAALLCAAALPADPKEQAVGAEEVAA